MPTIYDNIDKDFIEGLRGMLEVAEKADFCVGYFNLRGWKHIAGDIDGLTGGCRLLIGMQQPHEVTIQRGYSPTPGGLSFAESYDLTASQVDEAKKQAISHFAKQLAFGCPTIEDEITLKKLADQLRSKKVQVKFHAPYPLHAKMYLVHRKESMSPRGGIVGSSNLTLSGLMKNGELNIDVSDKDATEKLSKWFESRWEDGDSVDVGKELAKVIDTSWANGPVLPYHVYLKTALHLSQDAIAGSEEYPLPLEFRGKILDFQARAVQLAATLLNKQRCVMIGDVVGLGKTIIASAVAKTIQARDGDSVLVICPPKLIPMWKEYMLEYAIAGNVLSHGQLEKIDQLGTYKLLIVDESHNFRHNERTRYGQLADYITKNTPRGLLLTATPYNKSFKDIANQLELFIDPDAELGIRPDNFIREAGGLGQFRSANQDIRPSSLAAFRKSEDVDDWRELMQKFMVRRTRAHIKEHYAEWDNKTKRHSLLYSNGKRFYFPDRKPVTLEFSHDDNAKETDDYAKLYSQKVVDIIGRLSLPRYALYHHLAQDAKNTDNEYDKAIIKDLTRSAGSLIGLTRSILFKRLESSGEAFLLSIVRHIIRNKIYIAALDEGSGALPIGQANFVDTYDAVEKAESEDFLEVTETECNSSAVSSKHAIAALKRTYGKGDKKYKWLRCDYFLPSLREELQSDVNMLEKILQMVPKWNAAKDRKLKALHELVEKEHAGEKLLIFSQYKDTVKYLHRELSNMGVENIGAAYGGGDTQDVVNNFSPLSNKSKNLDGYELRVLIATDALSEGQNLQDAHIIVNYDLPWALVRLIQRVGRVDRIGQEYPTITCYSAMPEDGIEKIIRLRTRLLNRIHKNAELVGSDEKFFEEDEPLDSQIDREELFKLYDGTMNLDEAEGETDIISRAYDIWQKETKDDPDLRYQISRLPDVIYSAKETKGASGVIAYLRVRRGHDVLTHIDADGEVISQSQSHILDILKCKPETPKGSVSKNHHKLVRAGVGELLESEAQSPVGRMGHRNDTRRDLFKVFERISNQPELPGILSDKIDKSKLTAMMEAIHDRRLMKTSNASIRQMLNNKDDDKEIYAKALYYWDIEKLCHPVESDENYNFPEIICSMGLQNEK